MIKLAILIAMLSAPHLESEWYAMYIEECQRAEPITLCEAKAQQSADISDQRIRDLETFQTATHELHHIDQRLD